MRRVNGHVKRYPWGDHTFLPRLLGVEPDGGPWAELWLGTHPNGPATLDDGTPLADVTGPLPYLLKVLACAEPLSLQTHPNAEQARAGFAAGVYLDDLPKPELICAITPLEAFCGVRPVDRTLALLDDLGAAQLARVLAEHGPTTAMAGLYAGSIDVGPIVEACSTSTRAEAVWVRRLADRYPGEPSVAATLLLNHVVLRPGEALRLDAGNLHAYLDGAGVELMASSDNVVRAGLTTKPVDVDLLLDTFDPTPLPDPVVEPSNRYELPAAGVTLVRLDPAGTHEATGHELAIDLSGNAWYLAPGERFTAEDTTYVVTPIGADG